MTLDQSIRTMRISVIAGITAAAISLGSFWAGFAAGNRNQPIQKNERKAEFTIIQFAPMQQKNYVDNMIRFGEEVQYFVKAEYPGACKMYGPCDFNGDGWYSRGELERLAIYDIMSPVELEQPYVPVR